MRMRRFSVSTAGWARARRLAGVASAFCLAQALSGCFLGSEKPDLRSEFSKERHVRGVCSMARTNYPHSANSQFFICFEESEHLDGQYTVWGVVTEGMEHIDALPKGEPPSKPGKIVTMRVAADVAA